MSEKFELDDTKLWDEILKAIVNAMPEQLFPLFKEVYGKEYPKGTPIILLATEYSTYQENPDIPPSSRLTDITLLVDSTDYYHLECQMHHERYMVIRMIAYDLHVAMQYTTSEDNKKGEFVMHFPRSTVIYPENKRHPPEFLRCRIIFQDKSEHTYQIPTVLIQSYSLQEIHGKHLNLFIPYVLLRFRPKLNPKRKHPLTKKELTDFIDEIIFILQDELNHGYLTMQEFDDYINLFRFAAKKIFRKYPQFLKEVDDMTKPLIELPSVREERLRAENEALRTEKNVALAENDALRTEKNVALAENNILLDKLAEKDEELARMKELLHKHNIAIAP